MKETVYIDWNNEIVCSEKNREANIESMARDLQNYEENDEGEEIFEGMLEEYSAIDLFTMNDNEKGDLWTRFCRECHNRAEENFNEDFETVEVDV